jgi:DEAD/DEAH box helicase domain-containing protein
VATNALELGIDIGDLSASIMVGYPGTISSTWQQAGRAGRGTADSLAILITSANPLDQYLAHHSEYIFDKYPEQALINPDNLLILLGHIRCALSELPFQERDSFGEFSSEGTQELLNYLMENGQAHLAGKRYFWTVDAAPSQDLSLRTASPKKVVLQTHHNGLPRVIGEVDYESALWMVHPQAIYLHESQVYLVEDLDLQNKIATLHQAELDFYTEDLSETTVNLVELIQQKPIQGAIASYGDLQVTTQVVGFRRIKWITNEHLEICPLDLPPTKLLTKGYWLSIENETVERLKEQRLWSNQPNDYGSNWKTLKEQVHLRDGYRCQVCGVRESERAHDVHHKVPFRRFLSALEANQPDNLITLCTKCHQKVELNIRMRSGLAGLSYLLENLAPLFLMCDPRDLRVHIDQQSSLADQKPTVVIFDRVPGGIGLCERLYEICTDLLFRARQLVVECECEDGCPACVGPAGENGIGGKQETLAILDILVGAGDL